MLTELLTGLKTIASTPELRANIARALIGLGLLSLYMGQSLHLGLLQGSFSIQSDLYFGGGILMIWMGCWWIGTPSVVTHLTTAVGFVLAGIGSFGVVLSFGIASFIDPLYVADGRLLAYFLVGLALLAVSRVRLSPDDGEPDAESPSSGQVEQAPEEQDRKPLHAGASRQSLTD